MAATEAGLSSVQQQIVARAITDDGFRSRLESDPKAVLEEALSDLAGESISLGDAQVEVLTDTPDKIHLVIPAPAARRDGDCGWFTTSAVVHTFVTNICTCL